MWVLQRSSVQNQWLVFGDISNYLMHKLSSSDGERGVALKLGNDATCQVKGKESYVGGTICVNLMEGNYQHISRIEVAIRGVLNVDSHSLALGWIGRGAVTARLATSQAAERIERIFACDSFVVWEGAGGMELQNLTFRVPISPDSPSSIEAKRYKVCYFVQAVVHRYGHESPLRSPIAKLNVCNNRIPSLTKSLQVTYMEDEEKRLFVKLCSPKGNQVFLPACAFANNNNAPGKHNFCDSSCMQKEIDLEIDLSLSTDVERITKVEAQLQQVTTFNIVAYVEGPNGRETKRRAQIFDSVEIGDQNSFRIPGRTPTIRNGHQQSSMNNMLTSKSRPSLPGSESICPYSYSIDADSQGKFRVLRVPITVSLAPKNLKSKSAFLPHFRFHEVHRNHVISIKVEYLVKKTAVRGTGLRPDRYVRAEFPVEIHSK